jgi:flavin-dependent dehydrogenase
MKEGILSVGVKMIQRLTSRGQKLCESFRSFRRHPSFVLYLYNITCSQGCCAGISRGRSMALPSDSGVLVVGGGNAGFSAAMPAAQSGAKRVLLIDKCPEEWAGGNSYFTAGEFRTVHDGL